MEDNDNIRPQGHPAYDPIDKYRPLVTHANRVFRRLYVPRQYHTLCDRYERKFLLQTVMSNKRHARFSVKMHNSS